MLEFYNVILSGMRCSALFLALLVGSVVMSCTAVVDDGHENACHEQADCFSDMCTASDCVDGACVHERRDDGLICIGQRAPSTVFFGACSSGRCVESN
jgi:hypothetical protein